MKLAIGIGIGIAGTIATLIVIATLSFALSHPGKENVHGVYVDSGSRANTLRIQLESCARDGFNSTEIRTRIIPALLTDEEREYNGIGKPNRESVTTNLLQL